MYIITTTTTNNNVSPLVLAALVLLGAAGAFNNDETFPAPATRAEQPGWLANVTAWRAATRKSVNYTGEAYQHHSLDWTRTNYIQPQTHLYDRAVYNDTLQAFTIDAWLDGLGALYGPLDSVLMWNSYPNIGIDNRNQVDLLLSVPGGAAALRNISAALHARNVSFLIPYNPWDNGTRDSGMPDWQLLASTISSIQADGFNGDTMQEINASYWEAGLAAGLALALEPEGGGSATTASWTTLGWGYWDKSSFATHLDAWKWLDPRRLTNVCDRWAKQRIYDLQDAYFNGDGYETWQNVWGTYNGMTERDGQAVRRAAAILRFFGARGFLQSEAWVPFTLDISADFWGSMLFASRFALPPGSPAAPAVYLLVNRAATNISADPRRPVLDLNAAAHMHEHYYDCYHGVELALSAARTLHFAVEANGLGCVLATHTPLSRDAPLSAFLDDMRRTTARALASYDGTWRVLPQTRVAQAPTKPHSSAPPGMLAVRGAAAYAFSTAGVEIEGPEDYGVDFQFEWEDAPQRSHQAVLEVKPFFIDEYPVTNARWAAYIQASGYAPVDTHNYLKDWAHGSFPAGWANKPVTWVSLGEARGFCAFYDRRLPSAIEWQYAAQGGNGSRPFPWGDRLETTPPCLPPQASGRTMPGPSDVDAFPHCASPFGAAAMFGHVWEWTDEWQDTHTRAAYLVGSGYYRATGSRWYFPRLANLTQHNKLLLLSDSYDRSGGVGFRCAAD